MGKNITCTLGIDVDAVAAWLGTLGGENSPHDISRGMFAGDIGILRLLELLQRFDLPATWFVPGHSIETFPAQFEAVVKQGHEIGLHGYAHEIPTAMTESQEADVLDKCIGLITAFAGQRPIGYAAPGWDWSAATPRLLIERGIKYDHSLMHRDFECYRLRVGDQWTPIDYSKPAAHWMKPLTRGQLCPLIEIPVSWYLNDGPPMMFIKKAPNSHGFVNPRDIGDLWLQQFDWIYENRDDALFILNLHPDVSGRPQVLEMLAGVLDHILRKPGVSFKTMADIAAEFDRSHPLVPHLARA